MLGSIIESFKNLFHKPLHIFWICVALAATGVVLDGTAIRLWSLHREKEMVSQRIAEAKARSKKLDFKIHEAQSPEFIERAARDQFDLVKEGDLVFVFAEDVTEVAENYSRLPN